VLDINIGSDFNRAEHLARIANPRQPELLLLAKQHNKL